MVFNKMMRNFEEEILAPIRKSMIDVILQVGACRYTLVDGDYDWEIEVDKDGCLILNAAAKKYYQVDVISFNDLSIGDLSQMVEDAAKNITDKSKKSCTS